MLRLGKRFSALLCLDNIFYSIANVSSDCFECGYWNLDAGLRNLVFDDDNDKWLVLPESIIEWLRCSPLDSYVIDWEVAVPASAGAVKWNGLMYGMWEMIKYNRANPEDFTQWEW